MFGLCILVKIGCIRIFKKLLKFYCCQWKSPGRFRRFRQKSVMMNAMLNITSNVSEDGIEDEYDMKHYDSEPESNVKPIKGPFWSPPS